jgi:hypothetical protein
MFPLGPHPFESLLEVGIFLAITLAILCAVVAFYPWWWMTRYRCVLLTEEVKFEREWTSFQLKAPVKGRYSSQSVLIHPPLDSQPVLSDTGTATKVGLRLTNGTVAHPEMRLIDKTNVWRDLDGPWLSGGDHPVISFSVHPRGKTYQSLEFRSDQPFTSPRVEWLDRNIM